MIHSLPVPCITIDEDGCILEKSIPAIDLLTDGIEFIQDCFDIESFSKVKNHLTPFYGEKSFEANIKGKNEPFVLCDVFISWQAHIAQIVLIPIDSKVKGLEEKLSELRSRLASTDFELFEKKEALDDTLKRLEDLSGPFIPISENTAFVPLFGDITESKMSRITKNALRSAENGKFETIHFDFSAIGELEEDGVRKLSSLFQMLHLLNGCHINVLGIKPAHAIKLHAFHIQWSIHFKSSLKDILQRETYRKGSFK